MKKFLVIGSTLFLFTLLSSETANAQWGWGGGRTVVVREVTYVPVVTYRRVTVRRYPRYRYPRRFRGGVSISFGPRRRAYYPYDGYRRAAWYW